MNRTRTAVLIAASLALPLLPAFAGALVWTVDPERSKVTFRLGATGHDVEGTFAAPSGTLEFDPDTGAASGTIKLDVRGAQTGNRSRDKTMHKDVLQSETYPFATLTARRLNGAVAATGTSDVTLLCGLNIHGADHDVEIPAKVTISGDTLTVDGALQVPFVAWGLEDPSWFLLRVDKEVAVSIKAEGSVAAVAATPN